MYDYFAAKSATLATLLVVEANAGDLDAVIEALADESYQVLTAASVEDALAVLAKCPVDVVLANQQLIGDPGLEFLGCVRQQHPKAIRILLASASAAGVAQRNARAGWVHHYVPLPLRAGELVLVIYNCLVQRSFLPPESEGVLPIATPTLVPMSSRAPTAG